MEGVADVWLDHLRRFNPVADREDVSCTSRASAAAKPARPRRAACAKGQSPVITLLRKDGMTHAKQPSERWKTSQLHSYTNCAKVHDQSLDGPGDGLAPE